MENRRKFYPGGLWGNDTLQDRYEHVMAALDAYKKGILDDQDLTFVIKNAFVSKIYVSQEIAKAYPAPQSLFGNLSPLYEQLLKYGVLDLQDNPPALNSKYMEICDLLGKVYYLKKSGKLAKSMPNICIEHVVPANVYMPDVKAIKTFADFKKIFDAVSICLVTGSQAQSLNSKGLQRSMSKGAPHYTVDPFSRYSAAGVKLHPQAIATSNQSNP